MEAKGLHWLWCSLGCHVYVSQLELEPISTCDYCRVIWPQTEIPIVEKVDVSGYQSRVKWAVVWLKCLTFWSFTFRAVQTDFAYNHTKTNSYCNYFDWNYNMISGNDLHHRRCLHLPKKDTFSLNSIVKPSMLSLYTRTNPSSLKSLMIHTIPEIIPLISTHSAGI